MEQFNELIISGIRQAVTDAGEIMTGVCGNFAIQRKNSPKNLVTEYDKEIQRMLESRLSNLVCGAQFISEESSEHGCLDADELFIIDPIDGTTNFIHSYGYSAISVAYYRRGVPVYGMVFNPFSRELYEAQPGAGAYLNSRAVRVSDERLENSIVTFGTAPYNCETTDMTFEMIKGIYNRCQDIRRMGSASLDICRVADGRSGLFFEAALSLWDYAAAAVIIKEAGGRLVDFTGKDIVLSAEKTSVIAGSADIITESGLLRAGGGYEA